MLQQSIAHTYKRYKTLYSHRISTLPVLILMPHSACNCRCIMCDIWKDNKNLKQLNPEDLEQLLLSIRKLGTQKILLSGGEALLNRNIFSFCELLKEQGLYISLLSTGMSVEQHAMQITRWTDDLIISLDGHPALHDSIRNIKGAFERLAKGIAAVKQQAPGFPVFGRTVIHKHNFRYWKEIIETAKQLGLNSISFLPADVGSQAFNREIPWDREKQETLLIEEDDLGLLRQIIEEIISQYQDEISSGFIAESPVKLMKIWQYYAALRGHNDIPLKKCNAPWVSAVVESNGDVKPCFFHRSMGNIRKDPLSVILNNDKALQFRKELDMSRDETCKRCVCYLHLPPRMKLNTRP